MTSLPTDLWSTIVQYCPLEHRFKARPTARAFRCQSVPFMVLHGTDRSTLMRRLACFRCFRTLSVRGCWFGLPAVRLMARGNSFETLRFAEFVDCPGMTSLSLVTYLKFFPEHKTVLRIVRCPALAESKSNIEPYLARILQSGTSEEEEAAIQAFVRARPDSSLGRAVWRLDWFGEPYRERNNSLRLNGSLLLTAVGQGRVRLLRRLLDRRVRMDGTLNGFTPLHLACALNDMTLVQMIVRAIYFKSTSHDPQDATPHDPQDATPHDPQDATPHDPQDATPHDPQDATCIDDMSSPVHGWRSMNRWCNEDCANAFLIACALASPEIVRFLHGTIGRALSSTTNFTPLETAVRRKRPAIVRTLLELGYRDSILRSGFTALTLACDTMQWDTARMLLPYQPPRSAFLHRRSTALHSCCRRGHEAMVRNLLTRPEWIEAIDEPDQHGVTPCFYAAAAGHEAIVRFLLVKGAKPNDPHIMGTPVHAAIIFNRTGVLKTLFGHGGCPFQAMQTLRGPITGYELARHIPEVSNSTLITVLDRGIRMPVWPPREYDVDKIRVRCDRVWKRFHMITAEPTIMRF